MKQIFKDITAKLDTIAALNWIDEDKGQMNNERPPLQFPAALITLAASTNDLSRGTQQGQGILTVNLCFNFMGNTNNKTPQQHRDASLAYYDLLDEVHQALQNYTTTNFNELSRRRITSVARADGYKIQQLQYVFDFHEDL